MKKILLLLSTWTFIMGCIAGQKAPDDSFLEKLLLENIRDTPYTAHIKVTGSDRHEEIASDTGKPGYIIFSIHADVIETFKGENFPEIDYLVLMEAPSEGPSAGTEFIVSLRFSKERNAYYIPDNGYALPVTKTLIHMARSKQDQN